MKILLILALCLVGCASQKPVTVEIPIPVRGNPIDVPECPHLPIKDLTKNSDYATIWKAYVATVPLLYDWGKSCHDMARACQ